MNQNLKKPIAIKDLGEFTDEVILPGVERTVKDSEERLERQILATQNGINTILEKLQRMDEKIDRLEVRQDKERLEIKVIDWLTKRVDVLEKKLGITPEPILLE